MATELPEGLSGDRHVIARHLYERHWSYKRIGQAMSVSAQTVARWVDPERAERSREGSRAWKQAHREEQKAYDRRYAKDSKVPCPWCAGKKDPDREMCRRCRQALYDFRYSVVIGCYEDGWPLAEIAVALETTANCMSVTLNRLRKRGAIGYRYRVGPDGRRLPDDYELAA